MNWASESGKRRFQMATYTILSRFSPEAFNDPEDLKKLASKVSAEIKSRCPGVVWKESYTTLGRFDVVDIAEPRYIERPRKEPL
jgi:uncharacterized protein with GYD domain